MGQPRYLVSGDIVVVLYTSLTIQSKSHWQNFSLVKISAYIVIEFHVLMIVAMHLNARQTPILSLVSLALCLCVYVSDHKFW